MRTIGRYELQDLLGRGGMGVVYQAFDSLLERTVAVKIIGGEIDSNPDTRARFLREARSAGQLSHKNIVTIYDLGEEDGHPFLAMEYLEGKDLQQRLHDPEKMTLSRKVDVALELCEGLEFAHARGVVHRDVKPANIFITTSGEVKILDFGLARLMSSQLTKSNMLMGTLNYMAPEQVRGDPADHRSDVFSVGVVIYELLGNKKAFEGDSFASTLYKILEEVPEPLWRVDATVPHALAAIVERALAKPLDQRFQSMAALRQELLTFRDQLRAGSVVAAAPGGPLLGGDDLTVLAPVPPAIRSDAVRLSRPPESAPPATAPPVTAPLPTAPIRSSRAPLAVAGAIVLLLGAAAAAWVAAHRSPEPVSPSERREPVAVAAAAPTLALAEQALQSHDYPTAERHAAEVLRQSPGDVSAQRILDQARASSAAIDAGLRKARRSLSAGDFQTASRAAGDVLTVAPENADARQIMEQGAGRAASRGVADARLRMARAREQARAAKASMLAASAYATATQAEQMAEQLAASGHTADAIARFYEASGLYQSAGSIAQMRERERPAPDVPAPSARQSPPPGDDVTRRADAPLPPPPAPHPAPPDAPISVPVTVAPPPAPPVEASGPAAAPADEGIGQLIAQYRAALEGKDMDALKKMWPAMADASANAIRADFQNASRLSVTVLDPHIAVSGQTGTVTFRRRYELQTRDGQKLRTETQTTMLVRRTPAGWIIDSIRFSPAR